MYIKLCTFFYESELGLEVSGLIWLGSYNIYVLVINGLIKIES